MLASDSKRSTALSNLLAQWLSAADFAVGPTREVAIIGELENITTKAIIDGHCGKVTGPAGDRYFCLPTGTRITSLTYRPPITQQPTYRLMSAEGFVCLQPVNSPDEMEAQLVGNPIK